MGTRQGKLRLPVFEISSFPYLTPKPSTNCNLSKNSEKKKRKKKLAVNATSGAREERLRTAGLFGEITLRTYVVHGTTRLSNLNATSSLILASPSLAEPCPLANSVF